MFVAPPFAFPGAVRRSPALLHPEEVLLLLWLMLLAALPSPLQLPLDSM